MKMPEIMDLTYFMFILKRVENESSYNNFVNIMCHQDNI